MKEELTKLFREGMIIITASGVTIKDKITGCYTFEDDGKTYIIVKFSNGHVIANPGDIVSDDSNIYFKWKYNILDSNKEILCSIVKLKKE